jgi:hypothetical protein
MSEFPPAGPLSEATDYVPIVRGVGGTPQNYLAPLADFDLGGGPGGGVFSVFGRVGTVVAQAGDYTWSQISGSTLPAVNGAALTNLNAAQLTFGTIPADRLPSTLPASDGSQLTNLNASALAAGTIPDGRFPAILPAISGQNLTNLPPPVFGPPSALVGLTAIPGASTNAMRADAAPALNQAIAPTWTNNHTFSVSLTTPKIVGVAGQVLLEATTVLVSGVSAGLYLRNTNTGWVSGSDFVVTPANDNAIRSTTFTSGASGWNISAQGDAEFNNVDLRGSLRAAVLVYQAVQATAGTLEVSKSAAKLRSNLVISAAPTYGTTQFDIAVEDSIPGLHVQLFAVGDYLALRSGLSITVFLCTNVIDNSTHFVYRATIQAGAANVTYLAGLAVVDYGPGGHGFIRLTADQTNAPYLQMSTHTGVSSPGAGASLTTTARLRIGNLNGSYGYVSNTWGFATGQYGVAGRSWVTVDDTNGVRIGNNITTRIALNADGSGYLASTNIQWTTAGVTTIAGWTISSNAITYNTNEVKIAAGVDITNTAGTGEGWFGKGASGYYGVFVKGTTGATIQILAGHPSVGSAGRPFVALSDGAKYRVVIGELNSDVWGGVGTASNSMGMKIWDNGGGLLVRFADPAAGGNMISGWTIGTTAISSTGVTLQSGAGAGLGFGTSPNTPTSSSTGTGVWLDRTGLYGLNAGIVQAKFDALGRFVAGNGAVTIDVNGMTIAGGNSSNNMIGWVDTSQLIGQMWAARFGTAGTATAQSVISIAAGGFSRESPGFADVEISVTHGGASGQTPRFVTTKWGSSSPNANKCAFTFEVGTGGMTIGSLIDAYAPPPASVVLHLNTTTGAFVPSKLTTTQRDALTPLDGMLIYNTSTGKFQGRAAGAWVDLH